MVRRKKDADAVSDGKELAVLPEVEAIQDLRKSVMASLDEIDAEVQRGFDATEHFLDREFQRLDEEFKLPKRLPMDPTPEELDQQAPVVKFAAESQKLNDTAEALLYEAERIQHVASVAHSSLAAAHAGISQLSRRQ